MKIKIVNLITCLFGILLVGIGAVGFVQELSNWGWWLIGGLGSMLAALLAENS